MRFFKYVHALQKVAEKSEIARKHAAAVFLSGKPVMYSCNSIRGNNSCHAEVEVLRKFMISQGILWKRLTSEGKDREITSNSL